MENNNERMVEYVVLSNQVIIMHALRQLLTLAGHDVKMKTATMIENAAHATEQLANQLVNTES